MEDRFRLPGIKGGVGGREAQREVGMAIKGSKRDHFGNGSILYLDCIIASISVVIV